VSDAAPDSAAVAVRPNLTSIVLWIESATHSVLLGGDLERHPEYGWSRAISETAEVRGPSRAGLVKIPHHGSADADEPDMWGLLLEPNPEAVLTPFGAQLPRDQDVARLKQRTSHLRVAAGPQWSRWTSIGTTITTAIPGAVIDAPSEIGYVRYRALDAGWEVVEGSL
jgi:beta-lactamase superfamily II metal-dependent hydrolase